MNPDCIRRGFGPVGTNGPTSPNDKPVSRDGGPAFPVAEIRENGLGIREGWEGMTLRDYFAAKAMQSYAAFVVSSDVRFSASYDEIAREAYGIAAAMLAARPQP